MLRKRSIQLCGEFSLDSTEAKWVHTMRDSGSSRDEMVAAWQNHMKSSPESATLRVDYYLGNVDGAEILKHLSPKEPTSIQFQEKVTDGYWLKAHGVDAEFDILLKTPTCPRRRFTPCLPITKKTCAGLLIRIPTRTPITRIS